ncbi:uncharacterized protein FPRO_11812 [Fusarium proliferatum ET1]|uniref:Uncharacterized protein n=1 Tax=Fusarium proliferatum (strain ET1) TaxID=1227346 RepID=A0A1L7W127_FUSPR|nr:uncharacterized protein FPRO_11812 [Fusarium proliferatum ET1]CZR46364.1 uncharacterized protein FPRO_11812 [Fusarium proliferatum ET1]
MEACCWLSLFLLSQVSGLLTAPEQLSSGVSARDIHANVSSAVADAVSGVGIKHGRDNSCLTKAGATA